MSDETNDWAMDQLKDSTALSKDVIKYLSENGAHKKPEITVGVAMMQLAVTFLGQAVARARKNKNEAAEAVVKQLWEHSWVSIEQVATNVPDLLAAMGLTSPPSMDIGTLGTPPPPSEGLSPRQLHLVKEDEHTSGDTGDTPTEPPTEE